METSIVSYLKSHPSRDIVILAHQEIIRRWWKNCLTNYDVFISEIVLEGARRGNVEAAKERLAVLAKFPGLSIIKDVEHLAAIYARELTIPAKALRDALHIALASVHAMDYLLSWNCKHIANGFIRRRVREINTREGYSIPTICTPEELLDED